MYTLMALRVKPYFLPARWMVMGLVTAGDKSLLGDESRDEGLEEREWGDMGLANGEAPWWSTDSTGGKGGFSLVDDVACCVYTHTG